jgi:hypothetical protein
LDVGGLYHTIQVDFSGFSEVVLGERLVSEDVDPLDVTLLFPASLAPSLPGFSTAEAADATAEPKSTDVPGVFGVFAEDPKDAKAPEPRPNAEEAPELGEETLVESGDIPLNAFDLPGAELSPPNRLVDVNVRGDSILLLLLVSGLLVEM